MATFFIEDLISLRIENIMRIIYIVNIKRCLDLRCLWR